MANPDHVAKIKEGVDAWNEWRKTHWDISPDLNGADLRGSNLFWADLSRAELNGAQLNGAQLNKADLSRADLTRADLTMAELNWADLSGAVLGKANLSMAQLYRANCTGADLTGACLKVAYLHRTKLGGANLGGAEIEEAHLNEADLRGANLSNARLERANLSAALLTGADFGHAVVMYTLFADADLSAAKGLETINHRGPSTIGIDTMYQSGGRIPEIFLRSAGVPDSMITFMRSLTGAAFEFYSCFISYSSRDQSFVERLHSDMQAKNLRVWFAPEDLKIGDRFQQRIEESIHLYDKVLIVLSEHSVASRWVEREVNAAREREEREDRIVLFPIRIDDAVLDAKQPWAADLRRQRQIGDFRGWKDHDDYQKAFTRLLRDLKSEDKPARQRS